MFGIGGFELFIILVFGFLIFGPEKLPEIAKTVGRGIARFRSAQQEMNEALGDQKIFDPDNPDEPFRDPVEVLDKLAQQREEKKTKQGESNESSAGQMPKTSAASSTQDGVGPESAPAETPARAETFTERKARYDRERAARKAAQADEAAQAEAGEGGEA